MALWFICPKIGHHSFPKHFALRANLSRIGQAQSHTMISHTVNSLHKYFKNDYPYNMKMVLSVSAPAHTPTRPPKYNSVRWSGGGVGWYSYLDKNPSFNLPSVTIRPTRISVIPTSCTTDRLSPSNSTPDSTANGGIVSVINDVLVAPATAIRRK